MQKSLVLVLFLSTLFISTTQAITFGGVVEIIAGIMEGIIQKDDLKEIQQCVTTDESMVDNIMRSVDDFKEGGLAGYAEGFMEI